jgi:hypothetical protein
VLLAARDAAAILGLISGTRDTWQSAVVTILRVIERTLLLLAAGSPTARSRQRRD